MTSLNEDYEKYLTEEKKKQGSWAKISKQVSPLHILGVAFILFLGHYLYTNGKVPVTYFIGTIILIIGIIIYMSKRNVKEVLIPEHVIKQIAYDALDKKRRLGIEIPFDSKVRVTLVGEAVYEQDLQTRTAGIIKREVGFEIIRKGYKKTGVIGIHPYNGTILGIRWERTGYTGKETKDRTIIPVGVLDNFRQPSETPL